MPGGVVEQGESLKDVMLNAIRGVHFIDYNLTGAHWAGSFVIKGNN